MAGEVLVSPGLPTVMRVDGRAGRERDQRPAPQATGRWPTGRVLRAAEVTARSAFVTVVW